MMHMYRRSVPLKLICTLAGLILSLPAAAEQFRVRKTTVFTLPASEAKNVGINEAVAVQLPQDLTFIQGIEIDIKIPQIIASWQDSVAWTLFDAITPAPASDRIDYSGSHIELGTLPTRLSWSCIIPLRKDHTIASSPYAYTLDRVPDISARTLLIRFQQAMKGTPEEFGNAVMQVTIKPVLIDQGRLRLSLAGLHKQLEPYTLFVDGTAYSNSERGIFLDPGTHTVSIVSEAYRNEVRTVHIEQAKNCDVAITLRGIAPTVQIIYPDTAAAYFDDQPVTVKTPFVAEEGEHTVRFVIGNYETVRTVNVVKGRSYTIALSVDASITEEE